MAIKQTKKRQPKVPTNEWIVEFSDFFQGFSPLAHLDSLTSKGNKGMASVMTNADILDGTLKQGPGLTNVGTATELINYILDVPPADNTTYGIGATTLFKISSTAIASGDGWPHEIDDCVDGESVAYLKGDLFYLYNTDSAGCIGLYNGGFTDDWDTSLQIAPHPVATKEDIMIFGNGRYVGTYIKETTTLDVDKLDFGNNYEVADVTFFANQWYIAVNGGTTGTNRSTGQIYLYGGATTESILADETGVGLQKIGFLYVLNGIVYVAYQDLSSTGGYHIGYIIGRQIKRLASFTGGLPNFAQKTLYQGTILFVAGGSLWSCGAVSPDLPIQISQITKGKYATLGALTAPFGVPFIASTDGATNFSLDKFSGYIKTSSWKSIIIPTAGNRIKGYIDSAMVLSNSLQGTGETLAGATFTIEADQATRTSNSKIITTAGKMRHTFDSFGIGDVLDFRIAVSFANGSTSNPCKIRQILVKGHWCES